ncbi:Os08g0148266 [Oryza sativa Japonica Group]|uniref:Os08g0148266 protein n=1 Tax=Oryza sativa subsp. japonica TaxID=39947 RepID=C7J5T1_ORYSJ|nr:Os08g0148266 [Oryza sativa Japonica Group]|eukprot:NP_001175380.1 Os08g0148266 [Oryza sativa Japonica Group]
MECYIFFLKRKKYTEGPSTCHRVTKSYLNRKTRYNASPNLQNQCRLGTSAVLTPVLSDVTADSAWVPRGPHISMCPRQHFFSIPSSLPSSSPFPLLFSPLVLPMSRHDCAGEGRVLAGASRRRRRQEGRPECSRARSVPRLRLGSVYREGHRRKNPPPPAAPVWRPSETPATSTPAPCSAPPSGTAPPCR